MLIRICPSFRAALAVVAGLFLAGGLIQQPAEAQRVQRIAAIVNDDIVSVFDLQSRMRLVIASTGIKPTPQLQRRMAQQVLRLLIDERLQMQEAKRRNISVTKRDLSRAYAALEKQNNLKPGTFETFIRRHNLPRDALLSQIRAQIAWAKLIRQTIARRITVGPEEIDEEIARMKQRQGETEYRIAEIVLPVANPEEEQDTERTAQRLMEQLRQGADFKAMAQQMSRSASASVGGDLGWIPEPSLDSDLRNVVPNMEKGKIAGPIETPAGVRIVLLIDKRQVLAGSPDDATVDLRRIALPLPPNAGKDAVEVQEDLARLLADTVTGCTDFERAAKEVSAQGPVDLGKQRVGNLARPIRSAVGSLEIGKVSRPLVRPDAISVFMVCAREDADDGLPSREEIEKRLRNERIENQARRYLRDLRNAAVVDLRI